MANFGKRSEQVRQTLNNPLKTLCYRVVTYYNITLLVGRRGEVAQNKAFASGASTKKYPESVHNRFPSDGVDAAPWPIPEGWGDLEGQTLVARDLNWKERVKFYEMARVFKIIWAQMCEERPELYVKYKLRTGSDWDGDGDYRDQTFDDLVHIEVVEVG